VANWPMLAWLETVVKLAAVVVGITALIETTLDGSFDIPTDGRLVQFVVMIGLAACLVVAVFDRLIEHEIVAMLFVIANNVGHWSMVVALASNSLPVELLVAFCILMATGDFIKVAFLYTSRFQVRQVPRAVLYGLTLAYAGAYLAILLLELVA
jgi:hypothetical protein